MYDFAHGQSDSIEGVTHSLCDLAYEDHRPLYDWFIKELGIFKHPPDRVCPPEHDLYHHEQALPQAAGRKRACARLG